MRRPIVYMMGGFTAGLAAAHMSGLAWQVWMCIAVLAAAVGMGTVRYFLCKDAKSTGSHRMICSILIFLVFAAGAAYFSFRDSRSVHLPQQTGGFHILEGYVLSVKPALEENQRHKMVVQGREKVIVSIKGHMPDIRRMTGKKVRIRGLAAMPEGPVNPGLFDYRLYLKSIGVRVTMSADAAEVEIIQAPVHKMANSIAGFKAQFWDYLEIYMNQEAAGILFGMLFGDKTYIGQEVYEDFQKNGTAHILSVSGIHVGIIYACMEKTLGRKRKRSILYNSSVVALLAMYVAMSEFAPSVMRAVFMIMVYILSKQLLRPYDFTACTAFTSLVLLFYNPFYIYNTGFILSYGAVFVLAVLLPAARRQTEEFFKTIFYGSGELKKTWQEKAVEKLSEVFLPVCIIQIGMVPLTAYFFNYFSLSAFLVNIPVIFLSGFLLPVGFLLMGFSFLMSFSPFFFHFTAFLTEYPIRCMMGINHVTAKEGMGFFNIPSPSLKWIILYYFVIFFLSCETGLSLASSPGRKKYVCVALAALLCATLLLPKSKLDRADIIFIDVGQGDGIHVKTPEGKNILIDGGGSVMKEKDIGKDILYPYFMKNGVSQIDLAIVTHMHEDHYGGVASLAGLMPVKKIALFEGYKTREEDIKEVFEKAKGEIAYLKKGQTVRLGRDVLAQILYPDWQESDGAGNSVLAEDENDNSLVIQIHYKGVRILFTGDLPYGGEMELLDEYDRQNGGAGNNNHNSGSDIGNSSGKESGGKQEHPLKSDILKIGHHGSKTSSSEAFLEVVSPAAAVIQAGRRNNFGHPSPEVTERLSNFNIPVYRNDEVGAVLIDIERERLRVLDMKERTWKNIGEKKQNGIQ